MLYDGNVIYGVGDNSGAYRQPHFIRENDANGIFCCYDALNRDETAMMSLAATAPLAATLVFVAIAPRTPMMPFAEWRR